MLLLQKALCGVAGVPTLLLLSGSDDYVHPLVNYPALGERLAAAIGPSARLHIVPRGNHSLDSHPEEAAELISDFVSSLP